MLRAFTHFNQNLNTLCDSSESWPHSCLVSGVALPATVGSVGSDGSIKPLHQASLHQASSICSIVPTSLNRIGSGVPSTPLSPPFRDPVFPFLSWNSLTLSCKSVGKNRPHQACNPSTCSRRGQYLGLGSVCQPRRRRVLLSWSPRAPHCSPPRRYPRLTADLSYTLPFPNLL